MSTKTPKTAKPWMKKASVAFFAILFFMNISLAFTEDNSKGDISLFGAEITLFKATEAQSEIESTLCVQWYDICYLMGERFKYFRGN